MQANKALHCYNEDHNVTSASVVVPYLCQYLEPQSVIDIGCGLGQWLCVFEKYGATETVGIDGAHVPKELRKIDRFVEFDLRCFKDLYNTPLLLSEGGGKFDLCVNLEVAEHLPEKNAPEFVTFLTELSDCVLFSAAIPHQTGENHVNEQPHRYWVDLFAQRGYVCCDIFRKEFWNNSSVNWWYRQNMFLFIKQGYRLKRMDFNAYDGNQYVHPELFKVYISMMNKSMAQDTIARQGITHIMGLARKVMYWKRNQ